jgi:glycosyltransferase involved in cell wall biosynthesis
MATRRPLRILMLTDTAILGAGGSERFLRNLLARLAPERYRVDVMQLAQAPAEGARIAQFEHAHVRLLHRPIEAIYAPRGLAAYRCVRRSVAQGEYDIVQSQHEKSDLINACLPRVNGLRRISNRRDNGFLTSARVRALLRRVNGRFDRIVAPSRSILDVLVKDERADLARCRTIVNGVDTERFRPADAATRARLREQLGFADGECLIGCVASFSLVKRHVDLLAAFARALRRHTRLRLLLIGDGPLRADISAQIQELGITDRVHLLGARTDVENILPALDIFALASSTEGMSNALLEAQACGVPAVATSVGGNIEVIRVDNGVLVPPFAPGALAAALCDLVGNTEKRAAFGAAARRTAQREFSLAAMVAAYESMYAELADAH